jgi:Na+:H+ antiporter, NhaA family
MARRSTLDFLKTETASGLILALAALAGLVLANSPLAERYFTFVNQEITVQVAAFRQTHSLLVWVKDGLMSVFFFVVGLELKSEVLRGELANPRRIALPVLAALGGMIAPAGLYLLINQGAGGAPQGWPTPTATDIAFALAALTIAGPRLPHALRAFLLTLAIASDLAAVGLIAMLYTEDVHFVALGGAAAALGLMALLGRWKNAPFLFYAVCFVLAWAFTLESGVTPSIVGAVAAMTVPIDPRRPGEESPLRHFMRSIHPYVAFLILPLFAFSASGFSLAGLSLSALAAPVPMGVALGLFLGKQAGVFGATALAIGLKLGRRPTGAKWLELYGVALLSGVGFTLSLFIGGLAFDADDAAGQAGVRLGVFAGSLLSLAFGMAVLALAQRLRSAERA